METRKKQILVVIILILITFMIGCLCTDNPISKVELGNDQAVFKYIAHRMNYGEVPYKDWFDHKGPILYIINWIGEIISFSIIDGMWIINLLSIFITILFTQKILRKVYKLGTIESIILNFIINVNIMNFIGGGNLVEVFALPLITMALYFILTINKENAKKYNFIIGMLMAIVAFLRINMIVLWVVYYIYVTIKCIKEKDLKKFINVALWAFLGAFSITALMIIYLVISGNLIECIQDYILFNLKYSVLNGGSKLEVFKDFFIRSNVFVYCLALISLVISIKKKTNMRYFSLAFFILSWVIIVQPGNGYGHYMLILIPALIMPIAEIYIEIKNKYKDTKKTSHYVLILLIIGAIITMMPLGRYAKYFVIYNITGRDDEGHTELVEYIKQNTNDEDQILVIGGDCSIYLETNRKAASKYMYQIPIYHIDDNIMNCVIEDVYKNKPKYIMIVKSEKEKQIKEIVLNEISEQYKMVEDMKKYEIYKYEG